MPDERTIQKQIVDAVGSAISAVIHNYTSGGIAVVDNGNTSIEYEHESAVKTLSLTIESEVKAEGDAATDEYLDQLDLIYGNVMNTLFSGDMSFGGLVDEFREVSSSPEYGLRERGSSSLTMRINLEADYRHNVGDFRSQSNSNF